MSGGAGGPLASRRRVVVLGGGVSGLASACLLARDGHEVVLLERADELGGRAGVWRSDGHVFDTGPSWFLMPEVFEHFYRMMGTTTADELDLVPLDPAYRVYGESERDGSPIDVRSGVEHAVALFESRERGAGEWLRRYLASASRAYHAAIAAFLYNPFASWRSLVSPSVLAAAPALAPLLTRSLWRHISRRFRDARLRQLLGYPAVFLGTSPFDAPALYHLMSHLDLVDGVRHPRGGFAAVVGSLVGLARAHGVDVRTGHEAIAISSEAGSVRSVTVRHAGGTEVLDADVVVSAVDAHHAETALLSPADRSRRPRHWRTQVQGPGAVLVLLGVEGAVPELAHHSLLFADDWHEHFDAIFGARPRVPTTPSMYVSRSSATDDVAPEGRESLFVLVPVAADPALGHGGVNGAGDAAVERVADLAIDQLGAWAGVQDLRERIVVRRTIGPADFARDLHAFRGSALGPAHTLRQSAFLRGDVRSRRVRGLFQVGGTSVPGVGVPMCLISAELVLKHLRGDRTVGPSEEP